MSFGFSPGRIGSLLAGLAVLLTALLPGTAAASWIDLGGAPATVTLVESDGSRSVLEITIGGFEAVPVTINGKTYHTITLKREGVQQEKGFPALPNIRRSLIIPDDREMSVTLLSSEYVDFPNMPVAPSKGVLLRTVDPASVPYSFDPFYESSGVYPAEPLERHAPYILRDFRGMVVDANAFQYFPATQTLRIYTRMLIEVTPSGPGLTNVLHRDGPIETMDRQFAGLYENHFLNFNKGRYDPVLEDGGILIITYDAFHPHVEPLCEWKLQKGIPAKLVNLSEIGATADQIKDYILSEYNTTDLAYVLLVGDAAQIPTFTYSGGGADPMYSTLAGGDNYPEIFVGRFSAETTDHVDTQVARTITYERDQVAGEVWPQYGMGVASNQGPGHYGEYDDEHMDYIRDDLLAYGYYEVDRIYDPWATSQLVADGLNEGRGIINYCGHGSTTSWGSSGFSDNHVNQLVNDNMLPFICSVACVNGNFTGATCFGEAWLRATNSTTGEPTGAIAAYMSSINQSWNEPMEAEDETVDLLVADEMRTVGGIYYNGSCLMMDVYGGSGVSMFLTWIIFGDPSVALRTKTAETMLVNHAGTLFLGVDEYDVTVVGIADALCALYADGVLYGSALTDAAGHATITMDEPPPEPMTVSLTVTAYNKVTCVDEVEVIPADGPYLLIGDVLYLDGNEDEVLNAGEAVQMRVLLRNVGIETATAVSAAISTESAFIGITEGTQTYPDILPGEMEWSDGHYAFDIAPNCVDQHAVHMPIVINGEERLTWESSINFIVHAPEIAVAAIEVDDTAGGNGNWRLDPGESATITLTLNNTGSYPLGEITGVFTCAHPMINVTSDTGAHPGLDPDGSGDLAPPFEVEVDPDFPFYTACFYLNVTGTNSYARLFDVPLPVGGFYENVEEGAGEWTHYVVSGGFSDQWHVSTERNHTPGGGQSWKCGDTGAGDYASLLDAGLETPPIQIGGNGELRFWMWIDSEVSQAYPGRAYDGGLVEMSVDGGPFTQITPQDGYPYTIRTGSNPGPFPEDTPVFAGSFDWHQVIFHLGDVSGAVAFRFRFGSDGADTREGWHVDDIEVLGLGSPSDARESDLVPSHVTLAQNWPNPFASDARISFALAQKERALLQVFDPTGRLVRTLVNGTVAPGVHSVVWTGESDAGRPVASGVYYYRLNTGATTLQRSLILLR
jgi:uncharacterized cupredoxin-like copper-binding protein